MLYGVVHTTRTTSRFMGRTKYSYTTRTTSRSMGCTKYSYKYLNSGYILSVSEVTVMLTLVTTTHEPLSRSYGGCSRISSGYVL